MKNNSFNFRRRIKIALQSKGLIEINVFDAPAKVVNYLETLNLSKFSVGNGNIRYTITKN